MFTSTILPTVFAVLAAAAPTTDKRAVYHGVTVNVNAAPDGQTPVIEPAPVQINQLANLHNASASSLSLEKGAHPNVDINSVECRAYKDKAGLVPGSAPFTVNNPALLSTNLVEIGSVLCYITESS